MRNLKKILALVLALVMSFSLLATANAFNDSADIDGTYEEAVEVLAALKVFQGYDNGATFQPKGEITRAEVAAIIYRIVTGDVTDRQVGLYADYNKFDDVKSGSWYAGYVNFCANAEIIKGYDAKTFGPNDKVTGYQALAMILRAIGYDKNGEFTGSGWQVQTAAVGKKLGVTDNISAGTLGGNASREVVAEILFQTILVDQVTYTPALSYVLKGDSLGYETFKLVGAVSGMDDWGRPTKDWKLDKDADKVAETSDTTLVSLAYDPAASYTVKVDECDIANDLGITKAAAIEAAYIDGVKTTVTDQTVTTDKNGKIDPLATTSVVGGQGRITEVYDMGSAGYRIVEINTYLAQVTKVTASYTDRNGHTTDATINLNAYVTSATPKTFANVKATGFAVGDYVLVTITNPDSYAAVVRSVVAADSVSGGVYSGYTLGSGTNPDTTTVGGTAYNDADKFFYNKHVAGNWNVLLDTYGNIIGQAESATNYLVIEAVRWIGDGTLYGGQAIADVVLSDGSRVQNVVIASVGRNTANHNSVSAGAPVNGSFDTSYAANSAYYNHIVAYSVNEDGSYALAYNSSSIDAGTDMYAATITKGQTIMSGSTASTGGTSTAVGVNDSTVFLVRGSDGTYTTYVGKENVPSMRNATVCYVTAGNYASLVVVTSARLDSNTFDAYVDVDASHNGYVSGLGYRFTVYKEGSTEPTYVYYGLSSLPLTYSGSTYTYNRDGIFTFTVNNRNQLVDANGLAYGETGVGTISAPLVVVNNVSLATGAETTDCTGTSYIWNRTYVKSNDGNTMYVSADNTNTYWVDNATYIVASYDTNGNLLGLTTAQSYTEISWANTEVLVAYQRAGAVKQAAYVYVIDQAGAAAGDVTTTSISVAVKGMQTGYSVTGSSFAITGNYTIPGTATPATTTVPVTSTTWYRLSADGTTWVACDAYSVFAPGTYRADITVATPANGVELGSVLTNGSSAGLPGATVIWSAANTITYQFTY